MNKEITANHGESKVRVVTDKYGTMLFTGTVIGHTTGQPMNQKLANLTINVLQQYLEELDK
jgi:hypothetical protein|tara:strand:+ start:584 stop:766 length:183 start_codon:yes stop_codon:yes gene_type:complete